MGGWKQALGRSGRSCEGLGGLGKQLGGWLQGFAKSGKNLRAGRSWERLGGSLEVGDEDWGLGNED